VYEEVKSENEGDTKGSTSIDFNKLIASVAEDRYF
jgi:hypothetical protein